MVFLASVAHGLEEVLGRGAGPVTFRAGRQIGLKAPVEEREENDLLKALKLVWEDMYRAGIRWDFEPYKRHGQPTTVVEEDGKQKVELAFRNCMVRCSLFRYSHPQRLSLCLTNHGVFCGLVEQVYGGRASLDVIHAGENACLKVLTVEKRGES